MGDKQIDNKSLQDCIVPSLILLWFKLSGVFSTSPFFFSFEIAATEQYGVVTILHLKESLGLIIQSDTFFISPLILKSR